MCDGGRWTADVARERSCVRDGKNNLYRRPPAGRSAGGARASWNTCGRGPDGEPKKKRPSVRPSIGREFGVKNGSPERRAGLTISRVRFFVGFYSFSGWGGWGGLGLDLPAVFLKFRFPRVWRNGRDITNERFPYLQKSFLYDWMGDRLNVPQKLLVRLLNCITIVYRHSSRIR